MGFDSQLGGDFGHQGQPFVALPSPPNQQAIPSVVEQFVEDLFGGSNPGMASSIHTSLTHTNMAMFYDSSDENTMTCIRILSQSFTVRIATI
jgi:hypothetical protein